MAQVFESLKKTENNITKFEIYPNGGGEPIDITQGVTELYYYENVLSESVKLTVFVVDTGNAQKADDGTGAKIGIDDALKIGNGEKIYLQFNDAWYEKDKQATTAFNKKNPHKLSFISDDTALYLNEKEKLPERTQNSVYMFDLVSKEYLMNESTRVIKRYDGKISESARKILKEVLETKKELDIEVTENNFNFIGTAKKPLWTLLWLAKKSIPQKQNASGNTAGYFFFETYDGYKFKSIDTLLSDTGEGSTGSKAKYKSYIFNNSTSSVVPVGYDGKILSYESTNTGNFQNNLMMGSYNSAKNAVNAYDSSFNQNQIDIFKQIKGVNIAGLDYNFVNKNFIENPSRFSWSFDSVGVLPSGNNLKEQLNRSKDLDIDKSNIQNRSAARYNQLFTIKFEIMIAGDFSLRAGDLIYCDFPELTNKTNTGNNPRMGGIYMISALCHRIKRNETYTKLELIRDSYGRKPNKAK
tara:strand:- start:5041 stop:6447 length:1407 start_codon:yes stop_codon:yes gene_type:complete